MYGLPEETDGNKEDIIDKTETIFKKLEYETPYPEIDDAYRLGDKKSGINRPVKVTLRSADLVQYLLRRAGKLKNDDSQYRSVYLSPDRSRQDRLAHKELVNEMREMIKRDPSKYYVIRDKRIVSLNRVDKGKGGSSS